MIFFHGFGQRAEAVEPILPLFPNCRVISLDLFQHGETVYPANRIRSNQFSKHEFKALMSALMNKEGVVQFEVGGYSLGGKLALVMLEHFPTLITRAHLFAPDGIRLNPWYKLVTFTAIGRSGYEFILQQPKPFLYALSFLKKVRIISQGLADFASSSIANQPIRELVYKTWLSHAKINPDMDEVTRLIKEKGISVNQVFGKYDRIITAQLGKEFAREINQPDSLIILPSGHELLTNKTVRLIQAQTKKGAQN